MIHELNPITNAFVSVPATMGQLNCASFIAGIIAGVLDSAKFVSTKKLSSIVDSQSVCSLGQNAKVTAHLVSNEGAPSSPLSLAADRTIKIKGITLRRPRFG